MDKLNDYQTEAARTLLDKPDVELTDKQIMLLWNVIGLTGEAGEVAELAKKQIFHQHDFDIELWKKELGDVLWYVSAICTKLNITLREVMDANLEKLSFRFPNGYEPERTKFKKGKAK